MRNDLSPLLTLEFWQDIVARYAAFGPAAPILLAAVESLVPPLPLVAIVTLNIAGFGAVRGFLYSVLGTCIGCTVTFCFFRFVFKRLIDRLGKHHEKIRRAQAWVGEINAVTLFTIIVFPFTPSAFVNFAFGISDFPLPKYLLTLYLAKLIMIALLAIFGQSFVSAFENPLAIILSIALIVALYFLSKKVTKKHRIPK